MRGNAIGREPPLDTPDRELWRRSRATDAVEDEAERCLDLAGFADGLLDPDDRERVAERLAGDPDAAADIAAALALGGAEGNETPEAVVARACALLGGNPPAAGNVIPLRPRPRMQAMARGAAQWASLAAAVVIAGWLGFTLGMDASGAFAPSRAGDDGFLDDLIDPPAGLMRELTEGPRT